MACRVSSVSLSFFLLSHGFCFTRMEVFGEVGSTKAEETASNGGQKEDTASDQFVFICWAHERCGDPMVLWTKAHAPGILDGCKSGVTVTGRGTPWTPG